MARCLHKNGNIQQFTEICLDCGHNIYESDTQYEEALKQEIYYLQGKVREKRIEQLELEKDKLQKELKGNDDDHNQGW